MAVLTYFSGCMYTCVYVRVQIIDGYTDLLQRFAKSNQNLIILVDGVEHLRSNRIGFDPNLDWMTATLPPRVRSVVVCCITLMLT